MFLRIAFIAAIVAMAGSAAGGQTVPAGSGVTVMGRGVVRVHADALHFTLSLFTNAGRPAGSAAPVADIDGAAAAVAKALRDGGVADAAGGLPAGFGINANSRVVTGSLQKPTRDNVLALFKAGAAAALPFPSVTAQNLNVSFSVDDCGGAQTRAQDAALADARRRAEQIAHTAGIRLGSIVAVNEPFGYLANASSICGQQPDSQTVSAQIANDASSFGEVSVIVNLAVTYAILH